MLILTLTVIAIFVARLGNCYRFPCLNWGQCTCDTDEELIDCHNQQLKHFPALDSRLRGFLILSLLRNDLTSSTIPTEKEILKHFPDLRIIDFSENPRIECSVIKRNFKKLTVLSECLNTASTAHTDQGYTDETPRNTVATPTQPSTRDQNDIWERIQSKLAREALKTYAYASHTWGKIEEKYPSVEKAKNTLMDLIGIIRKRKREITR